MDRQRVRGNRFRPVLVACALVAPATPVLAPGAEVAHLEPSPHVESAPDLALGRDGERGAEAMASFLRAFILEDEGDMPGALAAYRRLLDRDPGYSELALKVAAEFARAGDVAEGIATLKDALVARPKHVGLLLGLSQLYARFLKKFDLAEEYARKAIEADPGRFAGFQELHALQVAQGRGEAATATLEKAFAAKSAPARYWLDLANLLARPLLDASEPTPAILAPLDRALERARASAGNDPEILGGIADLYVVSRRLEEAVEVYLKAVALKPEPRDPATGRLLEKLARGLLATGKTEEASRALEQLAAVQPDRPDVQRLLGELFESRGEFGKAVDAYERALGSGTVSPDDYERLANALFRSEAPGAAERAVALLRQARARFPDLPVLTYSLAIALNEAKAHRESLEMFEKALAEYSDAQPEGIDGRFYFAYGAAAERAGDLPKAERLLRKAIELDGDLAEAYNYLGYTWIDRNERLDEGGELVRKALEIDPENAAYLDSLGWYYYRKGEFEKALVELEKAAKFVQPEDAVIHDHLGDVHQALGDRAKALVHWERARALERDAALGAAIGAKIDAAKQKVTSAPGDPAAVPAAR